MGTTRTRSLCAAAFAVLLVVAAGEVAAHGVRSGLGRRSVRVRAVGSAEAVPDVARLVYTVEVQKRTVAEAREQGAEVSRRILEAVRPENERDVSTNRISTYPVHEWRERKRYDTSSSRITVGYKYSNQVEVTLRDLSSVADVTDAVLRVGGDDVTLGGVRFELEDSEHVENAARADAIAKARRYASTLAEGAGAKLGKVISIDTEDGGFVGFQARGGAPMYMAAAAEMADDAAVSAPAPISAGVQKTQVSVQVEFELDHDAEVFASGEVNNDRERHSSSGNVIRSV